jgi:dipeptidyl-peptidase 4
MRNARLCIVTVLAAGTMAWGQKKPVTLDAVLAPPRPASKPIWSPDGSRFLTMSGTKANLYEVSSKTQKELLDLKQLDGEARMPVPDAAFAWENRRADEPAVQWSPDGKQLLISRGSDLFLMDLAAGTRTQLTKTASRERDAKLAPNGKLLAFRLGHDLQAMDLATKRIKPITKGGSDLVRNGELDWVYPEELQLSTAYWWSPDSRRIAYLQFDQSGVATYPHADLTQVRPVSEPQRFPQAGTENPKVRLGIAAAGGGATRWVDLPNLDGRLIARVDWLPDSSALAVILLNRVQNELLWVRTDGKSVTTIYSQKDPAWVNLKDDYRFLAKSPRWLFGAERPDFRHLHFRGLDGGGEPLAITRGDWEVSDLVCVDEPQETIYFTSTEVSPLERHLYRVKFDGTGKTRLTQERGTHTISMPQTCSVYVDTHSSLAEPPRRTLHSADGRQLAVLQDRQASGYDLLPIELTTFKGPDGTLFHARAIKPPGLDPSKKYPAIVQVYGGPHAQTVRDSWRGADYDQFLAHRGFVIWQMDNRGSAGRGHAWESKLYRRFGKQELEDQLEGVRHLLSLGFVDPARVGINGWSYGGFLTLYSLFNAPTRFAAGIAGAPVTDWRQYDTIYTERYLGLPQQNEEGYRASSPVFQAANLKGKLMLVHNFEDDNVLFQHSLRMVDALQKAGKPFEMMLYPQKAHGVGGPVRRHMLEGMTAFWERSLLNPNR